MTADPHHNLPKRALKADQRSLFSQEGVYKVDTISQLPSVTSAGYSDLLLRERLDIVRRYASHSNLLDVCCATGQHLIGFANEMPVGIGIDFSFPYLQRANADRNKSYTHNVGFSCCDAKKMPFRSNYFDVVYSFSSLYVIPDVGDVICEMARVLKLGGKCILDLGNLYSLNVVVANAYHKELGWAQQYPVSVPAMKRLIEGAGLRIIEHRAFQILPLWGGDRPKWLRLFLAPAWTRFFSKKVKGKMLDEWLSNLSIFKLFAFRHVFVCEKR